jgi:hypothetical protein
MNGNVFRNMTRCSPVESHRLSCETLINFYRYSRRHIPEDNPVLFKETSVASPICTAAALLHTRHDVFCCQASIMTLVLWLVGYMATLLCVCAYPMQGLGLPGAAVGRGRCEECNPTPAPHPPPHAKPPTHDAAAWSGLKLGWHLRQNEAAGCLAERVVDENCLFVELGKQIRDSGVNFLTYKITIYLTTGI